MRRRAALLAALLLGFGLLLLAVETAWGPLHRLDLHVADSLHRLGRHHPAEVTCWRVVSIVFYPDLLRGVALVAAVVLWWQRRRAAAVFVVVAMAGQWLLEAVTKAAVGRARPAFAHPLATAAGASFPSGHAMASFVACAVAVLLVPRRARAAVLAAGGVLVALVGFSRLALAVHYVTDVAGGWLLGAAWVVLVQWLIPGVRAGRPAPDPPPRR